MTLRADSARAVCLKQRQPQSTGASHRASHRGRVRGFGASRGRCPRRPQQGVSPPAPTFYRSPLGRTDGRYAASRRESLQFLTTGRAEPSRTSPPGGGGFALLDSSAASCGKEPLRGSGVTVRRGLDGSSDRLTAKGKYRQTRINTGVPALFIFDSEQMF